MKYNDKVRVTSGFYEGMEGEITYIETNPINGNSRYIVALGSTIGISRDFIPESSLELIK